MPRKDERYKLRKVPRKDLYWVVDSSGKHYSKEGLPKERAREQQKALYASADGPRAPSKSESPVTKSLLRKIPDPVVRRLVRDMMRGKRTVKAPALVVSDIDGSGIISDALKKAKEVATKVANNIKRVVTKGVRTGLPPKARQTLETYGSQPITSLQVRRDPIQSFLNIALDAISFGYWSRAKRDLSFDKLFHLGLVATVGGRPILIEKNEVINISPVQKVDADTEFREVRLPGQPITLDAFIAAGQQAMGGNFIPYDPFKNNCQDFILNLLRANRLLTPELTEFIKQPTEALIRGLPAQTPVLARKVTDIAAVANNILEGEGRRRGGLTDIERHRARFKGVDDPYARWSRETQGSIPYAEWLKRDPTAVAATAQHEARVGEIQQENAARQRQIEEWNAEMKRRRESPFNPIVEGLTKAGDFAAKALSFAPGVGSLVSDAYKTFAPPGSEFYQGSGPGSSGIRRFNKGLKGKIAPLAANVAMNVIENRANPLGLISDVAQTAQDYAAQMTGGATHRQAVLRRLKLADKPHSLAALSKASKVPKAILQEVYNRGIGAYKTQPKSVRLKGSFVKNVDAPASAKLSKEQWALARVYSFLNGNPKHDNDLRANGRLVGNGLSAAAQERLNLALNANPDAEGLELIEILAFLRLNPEDREIARQIIVDVLDLPENTAYGPAARSFMDLEGEELYDRMWDVFERMLDDAGVDDPEDEEEEEEVTQPGSSSNAAAAAPDPAGPDPYDPDLDPEERFQMQPAWLRRLSGGVATVTMKKSDFIKEHKKLIALLKKVGLEGLEQEAELKKMTGGRRLVGGGPHKDRVRALAAQYSNIPGIQGRADRMIGVLEKINKAGTKKALAATAMAVASITGAPFSFGASLLGLYPAFGMSVAADSSRAKTAAVDAFENALKREAALTKKQSKVRDVVPSSSSNAAAHTPMTGVSDALEFGFQNPMFGQQRKAKPTSSSNAAADAPVPEPPSESQRPSKTKKEFAPVKPRGAGISTVFKSLQPAKAKGKKWTVKLLVEGKPRTVHFGDATAQDYTQHHDKSRREDYLRRHKARENWGKSGIATPGFWSKHLLWGPHTSIAKNLKAVRRAYDF